MNHPWWHWPFFTCTAFFADQAWHDDPSYIYKCRWCGQWWAKSYRTHKWKQIG